MNTAPTILPAGSSKTTGCRVTVTGAQFTRTVANLRRKLTPALTAAGFDRTSFRYSNESREHAHYPRPDDRDLDSLGLTQRPGIMIYPSEPNQYTSGAAHIRAQCRVYEMAAALAAAGFAIVVKQNHSGDPGSVVVWADENGLVV